MPTAMNERLCTRRGDLARRGLARFQLVPAVIAMLLALGTLAVADGGKAKTIRYVGEERLGANKEECTFRIELQPVLFYLATVDTKYQVVLMRVVNDAKAPLLLSRSKDRVTVKFGSKTISAELDLATKDTGVWDKLPLTLRQAVFYPTKVPAGEEEGIYVFIPTGALQEFAPQHLAPSSFSYSIDSLGKTIDLKQPTAMAAMIDLR